MKKLKYIFLKEKQRTANFGAVNSENYNKSHKFDTEKEFKNFIAEYEKKGFAHLKSFNNPNRQVLVKDDFTLRHLLNQNFEFAPKLSKINISQFFAELGLEDDVITTYTPGALSLIKKHKQKFDFSELEKGTGKNGRVTLQDVRNFIQHQKEVQND